jgi:uncharacterized membrane protein YhiD involved in acid resistance
MNGELALQWLSDFTRSGTWVEPLRALVAAFVFGQVLAWTYEFTFQGLSYSRGFSHTVVLVCMSAAILVLAMGHSILAGLGLFGVLSMIRFRVDLKTPRDLVFIMGSACVGVACGVGAIVVAVLGAVLFSAVTLYLHLGPFGARVRYDGVLRFRVEATADVGPQLRRLLNRHCRRQHLLTVGEAAQGAALERAYQVKFFRDSDREALLSALREELSAHDTQLLLQDATRKRMRERPRHRKP